MPHNSFGSNGPSAYIPLEKELSRGIVRGLSPFSVPFFPSVWRDRNPLSLEDSLESGDAGRDRDDIMSDSTFGTEFRASVSDLFSDQGNPLVDKDLPLAHSQSADGTHPLRMTGLASKRRRGKTGSFGQPYFADLCYAFADECIPDHYNSHYDCKTHSCPNCPSRFGVRSSLTRHLKTCKGLRSLKSHMSGTGSLGDD